MKRTMALLSSAALLALSIAGAACAAERPVQAKGGAVKPSAAAGKTAKTVVYYFHGTSRCMTCRTIEAYAEEAVKAAFASELASGATLWQPTNVDEPANAHFVKDYQLFTRSLVVVDAANPKRFKNLDRVWQLVRDKPAFLKYVQDEVRAFGKSQG
jgi:hypothetical protein